MSERDEHDVEPTMATGAEPVAEMDWDGDMPELIRIGPQLQQPMIGPVVARNAANTELPLAMRPEDRFTQRQLHPAVNIFERMAEKRDAVAAAAGGGGAPELAAHVRAGPQDQAEDNEDPCTRRSGTAAAWAWEGAENEGAQRRCWSACSRVPRQLASGAGAQALLRVLQGGALLDQE